MAVLWSEGCIRIMSGELKFSRWVICQSWCLKCGANGIESVTEVAMAIAASRQCTRGQPTPTRSTVWRRWAATSSASLPAMMPGTDRTRTPSASPPPRHHRRHLKVLPSLPWSWSVPGGSRKLSLFSCARVMIFLVSYILCALFLQGQCPGVKVTGVKAVS